jgi:hypothetical protein
MIKAQKKEEKKLELEEGSESWKKFNMDQLQIWRNNV